MAPTEPTQAEILRERAARVPWRRAARDALLGLVGRGPMELPDRFEGAVYGHLLGAAATGRDGGELLDSLDGWLSGAPAPSGGGAPAGALAAVLADPDGAPLRIPAPLIGTGDPGAVTAALYGQVSRRLLAGERNGRSALAAARRELGAGRLAGREMPPQAFDAAWRAFEGAQDPVDAVARARSAGDADVAPMAGGLAGLRWGGSSIPVAERRAVGSPARARRVVDGLIERRAPGPGGTAWQTSTSHPLTVHGVDLAGVAGPMAGAVGITPLPGRRCVAYHTGAHWRDLDADVDRLRALGIDLLFLLVEDRELARCRVTGIAGPLADLDISLVRFPIRDPLVPRDGGAFRGAVTGVLDAARQGSRVAIACRGGFDRAGMAAACVLREAGLDAASAIERVQRARPGALTLPDQQVYVRGWPPAR